jgi:hypothetical protein
MLGFRSMQVTGFKILVALSFVREATYALRENSCWGDDCRFDLNRSRSKISSNRDRVQACRTRFILSFLTGLLRAISDQTCVWLIGKSVPHSFSKEIRQKVQIDYLRFADEIIDCFTIHS